MGHYLSEMENNVRHPSKPPVERETIQKFYGEEYTVVSSPCRICGASIEWNYTDADNLMLHIKWHENLAAALSHRPKPYPGLEM